MTDLAYPGPPPTVKPIVLRCAHCAHRWRDYLISDCPFDVAIAAMKSLAKRGCPACGKIKRGTVLLETGEAKP